MGFADDLGKFEQKVKLKANLVVKKIVFDVGTSLVLKSPVGDGAYWKSKPPKGYAGGRFRANWQYGEGSINFTVTQAIDKTGTVSFNNINAGLGEDASGKVHFLTNSLPYSLRLENGWSRQAPQGMRDLTILEFQPIVDAAARALNQ